MGVPAPSEWLKSVPGLSGLPAGGLDTIAGNLIPYAVSVLLFLLVFLSLLFLIIGGIRWITSGGDKEGMAKAKGTVTYAIIGLVLGLASFIILNLIGNLFWINLTGGPARPGISGCYDTCIRQECSKYGASPSCPSSCQLYCNWPVPGAPDCYNICVKNECSKPGATSSCPANCRTFCGSP